MGEVEKWVQAFADNTARGLLAVQGQVVADNFKIDIRTSKNEEKNYTAYYAAGIVCVAAFSAMYLSSK
jgi:hypothetical protein